MSPLYEDNLASLIAEQERRHLALNRPPSPDLTALLGGREFVRVNGIASFWRGRNDGGILRHAVELAIAAHGYGDYLTFVLCGDDKGISIHLSLDSGETTRQLLRSVYPGAILDERSSANLSSDLAAHFRCAGMITGIPALTISSEHAQHGETGPFHLERIIRGMRGERWAYVVQAFPRSGEDENERERLLTRMSYLSSRARQQVQRTIQESKSPRNRETQSASEVRGGEIVDRQAEYSVELLERALKRSERTVAVGRWQTAVYFGTDTEKTTIRVGSLLASILRGPDSKPEPIRLHMCTNGSSESAEQYHTYLSSEELALEILLPSEEVPGFAITDYAPFDVNTAVCGNGVGIGKILWDDRPTAEEYCVEIDDLTRHGVVFGVTGSGKTTTLLGLLCSLRRHPRHTPFLVIEPAKTEYRGLLGQIRNGKADGEIPDLRVYTLGNDTVAPFRLNPFEFDLPQHPVSVPVLAHIDFLKAVFNAAFILYAPMPYVLDMALHEVYQDKGWNLATGVNVRLSAQDWEQRHLCPIFPTLTDLYHKVETVTRGLGYEAKVEQDVVAGLKARLGSLRLGAKGLMLDTPRGIPMDELLSHPAVLELEHIGNDDEKTFVMGLLLARMYGFRRLQAATGRVSPGLQHLLVIEESHRLLKDTSTTVETDSANLRAQAIETFINMLSEVRHYGQGVLVAEQIPSKLTHDVVKNTNLKIIHRLLAQDDRELVGKTMNMTEDQMRRLAWLRRGQAVVFAEGDDHPLMLEVENSRKSHPQGPPNDASIATMADSYVVLQPYLRVPGLDSYGIRLSRLHRPDPIIYQEAIQLSTREGSTQLWARLMLQIVFSRQAVTTGMQQLRRTIVSGTRQLLVAQHPAAMQLLLVLGVDEALQSRGAERGWSFAATDALRHTLTVALVRLARSGDPRAVAAELDRFARAYEGRLRDSEGPYPGCQSCRAICLYGSDIRRLATQSDYYAVRGILGDRKYTRDERYTSLASMLRGTIKRWLNGDVIEESDMAYCLALTIASSIGMDMYEQEDFGMAILARLQV